MKIFVFALCLLFVGAGVNGVLVKDAAALAGQWTKCYAESGGKMWYITYGQSSKEACHALAKKCTGDNNVTSHYSTNPILLAAPYQLCNST